MRDALIVSAVRTPVGRAGGALADVRPDDLAAVAIKGSLERLRGPVHIDDVIFGCTNQAGEDNRNVARMALLLAGLPKEIPGATVNRLCGSGLDALGTAAREQFAAALHQVFVLGTAITGGALLMTFFLPAVDFHRGVTPDAGEQMIAAEMANLEPQDEPIAVSD